mmetsp:Transcript_20156/g.42529  ORF Transcript_20156/g.42529 Transcript_20156/m.42529 type:complete len:80 (+) Transcript_20156:118-357(+)
METFFHLVLILDPADIVYDYNLAEAIEDITLKYLKANIGGENRFTPISISTIETASSSEQVGSSENDILISTVMKIRAT